MEYCHIKDKLSRATLALFCSAPAASFITTPEPRKWVESSVDVFCLFLAGWGELELTQIDEHCVINYKCKKAFRVLTTELK